MSKPTVMMVSKAHQTNVKRLYKMIFQLHKSMPIELRDMGNAYVRNEFKLHKSANPDQTKTFMKEWGVSLINFFHFEYAEDILIDYIREHSSICIETISDF